MNRKMKLILAGAIPFAVAIGMAAAMMQSTTKKTVPADSPAPSPIASNPPRSVSPQPANPIEPTAAPTNSPTPIANNTGVNPDQTTPSRQIVSCKITMVKVDDPDAPLNVRAKPTITAENVIGQVKNGTYLSVVIEQNGWLQISNPIQGWVAKSRTQSGCNIKVERVNFDPGNTRTEISDRFIGTGGHTYLVNGQAGQTMTLASQNETLPSVISPNGKLLVEMNDQRDRWTIKLPTTGDYKLQLDSNYKGYVYSFIVEIK